MRLEEKKISDDELAHWLAFGATDLFGSHKVALLEEHLQSLKTAWNASDVVLQRLKGIGPETIANLQKARREIDPYKLLENFKQSGMKVWTWHDPKYPLSLRHIHLPPPVLYVNGDISFESFTTVVGVVGTRHPSTYGQKNAKEIGRALSENGITVVSGMAAGCDSLAHWGAIEGGSPTIAVLGCGADVCYPSGNRKLFDTILEGKGAIVSEYPPGTPPETFRFPQRNRIIAGLCRALVVVEGLITSGSLITAKLAFEGDRDVFAFPGRIDNRMAEGPHDLIKRQSARLCTGIDDILEHMNFTKTRAGADRERPAVVELFGREKEVYGLITHDSIHFDQLCSKTDMDPGELSAVLTMLELAGLVLREPGDWYSRHRDIQVTT